jgi:hypothetical protein
LIVDGIPQPFEVMEHMPASEVVNMEFISASEATIRFGTGYPNGAILVTTPALAR